jgi:alpha-L-fucosidase
VAYAQRLNDASEVRFERDRLAHIGATDQPKETLALELPVQMPDVSVPVIELFMEAEN